jgi:Holliday junction resolvasome RuvABC endonuclease subunit
MNILALDVATKTGWCSNEAHGVWDFKLKRDESSGMRLIRFKAKLQELFKLDKPDLVVFEMTAGRYKAALIVQSELHGVLKETCENHDIPYKSYPAKEIKKFATGNGNASKEKMIKAVKDQMEIEPIDDNHADALWLWELAAEDHKYA